MRIEVKNLDGAVVGETELADAVFAAPVRPDILQRVVTWQLAKRRAGTHKVKTRREVRGTTAKMYKQKGTGRARHGARTAPQFKGGGQVFGPVNRDHGFSLPKKVRAIGLRSALSAKAQDGKLIVLDDASMSEPKTKALAAKLAQLGVNDAIFLCEGEPERNFALASRNLPKVEVLADVGANVYDILRRDRLVVTRAAAERLAQRLG